MIRRWSAGLLCLALVGLTGCGDEENSEGLRDTETKETAATQSQFNNWESIELQNGLVRVVVVPSLGGRAMVYDFAGQNLLYVNPKYLGTLPGGEAGNRHTWAPGTSTGQTGTPEPAASEQLSDEGQPAGEQPPAIAVPNSATVDVPGGDEQPAVANPTATAESDTAVADQGSAPMAEAETVSPDQPADPGSVPVRYLPSPTTGEYTNYGGEVVWPGPRSHWTKAWPPPAGLDLGDYTNEIQREDGDTVRLVLTSPDDTDLGVQLTKTLMLYRASTVMRVKSVLKNTGERTRTWSQSDVSQHPGALAAGERFSRDTQLLIPLNPESKHHLGYRALLGSPVNNQYFPENGQLRVEYLGEETWCGADTYSGWVAYVDRRHDLVMAKIAYLRPEKTYPDQNLTVTAYTSPADSESYLQATIRSPLVDLAPGEEDTFNVWYGVCRCPAPYVYANRAGVVSVPLTAEKLADSVRFTGVFGSFYTGHAQLAFYNEQGETLARTEPIAVSPMEPYKLDTIAHLPDGAVRAALIIRNHRRADVDVLSDTGVAELQPNLRSPEPLAAESPNQAQPGVPDVKPNGVTAEPAPRTTMPDASETGQQPPAEPNPTGQESPEPKPATTGKPRGTQT